MSERFSSYELNLTAAKVVGVNQNLIPIHYIQDFLRWRGLHITVATLEVTFGGDFKPEEAEFFN